MTAPRLSRVLIFVKDLARVASFYQRVFSLDQQPTGDPGFVLLGPPGDRCIALHAIPAAIAQDIEITTPPQRRGDVAYKICFEVSDVAAYRQAILDAGGCADAPWTWEQTHYCECTDPEGNTIQIYTPAAA